MATSTGRWWAVFALSGVLAVGCDDDDGGSSRMDGGLQDGGGNPATDGSVGDGSVVVDGGVPASTFSFFVSSETNPDADLGGIEGADTRCQRLAAAVGAGAKTWRAFLSVERDMSNGNQATHARDRIGTGPWHNVRGALIANDITALLARAGDAELFLDERGRKINGQWLGSPTPNEHDILTGTGSDGRVAAGKTCNDWTLGDATFADGGAAAPLVGHSDGLGPNQDALPPRNSWHSAHEAASCANLTQRGGTGRIYCFARN